jgi:MYXO-CTERM domain-containing protein
MLVVIQVAAVVLYRIGKATGWPVPVGLVVLAGLWMLRRRQRGSVSQRR